ncbi:unnamed protein product [Schistocephalus solidus]|uniref:Zinc finger protein 655 n=1 Tax=Schistocephalus solidus TaxID=70667 RepID=A0A183SEP1_SCHSO|nr:unnamed protein product [Schistocephalus solidus]
MVAAPSEMHLPQNGGSAEDSGLLQDFHVQDPFLPSQLQYSEEVAEIDLAGGKDHIGCSAVSEEAKLAFREQVLL